MVHALLVVQVVQPAARRRHTNTKRTQPGAVGQLLLFAGSHCARRDHSDHLCMIRTEALAGIPLYGSADFVFGSYRDDKETEM
eukprot:COSAG01_NODE_1900_length_8964_cov_121.219177_12_plen_83_part_00